MAGQSYGGLSALYAALHWPDHFGCVLAQSGSFWWPEIRFITEFAQREDYQAGFLIRHVLSTPMTTSLRIFLEAGLQEPDILYVNQQMRKALDEQGHDLSWRAYSGGHDIVCWRGGLLDGVRALLTTPLTS
ncbi:MAG: Enterochelin esterase [Candidatus Erwinia impunctatus]